MLTYIPMVITDEFKNISYGTVRVVAVHGFNNNTGVGSDRYLQLFEQINEPAASAVPTFKSLWFPGGAATVFGRETFGESGIPFGQLVAAVSSTEENYTAVTNTGLDITLQVDGEFLFTSATTIVGDLTSNVGSLQVWTEASGASAPKRLLRLDMVQAAGFNNTLVIHALDSGVATDVNFCPRVLATGTTYVLMFGRPGLQPMQNTATGTPALGCTIRKLTTSSGAINAAANAKIRAIYE